VDLQVPIQIVDELSETLVRSTGSLDLASGEIRGVQYEDYDLKVSGLPAEHEDYEFTSGTLSNAGKDVEFRVEVDIFTGKYSVNAGELLEIKVRAAKLFAGIDGKALAAGSGEGRAKAAAPASSTPPKKLH
jgi:hypothetical protein